MKQPPDTAQHVVPAAEGMALLWGDRTAGNAGRLESFFGAVTTKHSTTGKRKEPDSKSKPAAKRGKMGGVGKKK